MKKYFIHIFVAIFIVSSAFPTFSVSALSSPRIIEPEPQILRNEQVRLDPLGTEAPGAAVFPETSFQDRMPNADLPEEIRANLLGQTEPVEERVYILPTAEQIAQTQAEVLSFDCYTVTDVPTTECEALVALYNSTNGAGWTNRDAWLTGPAVDEWYGVGLEEGNVVSLVLSYNLLSGSIPPQLGNLTNLGYLDLGGNLLSGSIPASLGMLSSLEYLDLYSNDLNGSIPSELGNLGSLKELYLGNNQLEGGIPAELGDLSYLQFLDLGNNQLTGSIPAELGSLSNLYELYLYSNQLSGSIPPELGNLLHLIYLSLHENHLTGSIPTELGSLSNLDGLFLHSNQLSGSIPTELGSLSNLYALYLDSNQLSGSIPLSFVDLDMLEYFNFYATYLCEPTDSAFQGWKLTFEAINWKGTGVSCISTSYCITESEIPDIECEALVALYNSTSRPEWVTDYPNWFSATLVSGWEEVTVTDGNVTELNLSGSQFKGNIPPELGNLTNLQTLDLSDNQLSGIIPSQLGNLTSLVSLDLFINQLTGSIPPQLGNLTNLEYLALSANRLTGSIPTDLGKLISLEFLDLSNNQLSSRIPSQLGNLASLVELWLGFNQLTGNIPLSFTNLTNLRSFSFEETNLCEPINPHFQAWKETFSEGEVYWSGTGDTCIVPVAVAEAYTTAEDTPLTVSVSEGVLLNDIDEDPLSAELVADVTNGTLALSADGSFTYTPNLDFTGVDSFTYEATDGELYSDVVTVTIMVTQVYYSIYLPLIIK